MIFNQSARVVLGLFSNEFYLFIVYRDAMIVSIINCSTSVFAGFVIFSVLGFMAHVSGKDVKDVATSGPGLAFVVYPEGIAQMPISPFWAVMFFFMLLTLGLDTQFAMFEAVVTGLVDEYPRVLKKRKELFIAFLCFLCFLLGIPMVMQVRYFNLYLILSTCISGLMVLILFLLTSPLLLATFVSSPVWIALAKRSSLNLKHVRVNHDKKHF